MRGLLIVGVLSFHLTFLLGYAEKILFQDDFSEGVLSSNWQWLDPKGDSILSFSRPGWLEIKAIPGNDLQPNSNLNAPRLLYVKRINGDFAIETSISALKNGRFQSGGLLIWKDGDNYLRFERGTWGSDTVILQKREQGVFGHVTDLFFEKNPTYLRVERRKGKYRALIGEDGRSWKEVCKFNFDVSDPLRVGIHAICMGVDLPPTVTGFGYFKLLRIGDEAPYIARGKTLSEEERRRRQILEGRKLLNRAREILSKTASERRGRNRDVISDPETGVKFRKKLVAEKLDVIREPYGVVLSPDGRFLYDATDYWVVPLEKGEPFKMISGFRGDVLGRWSPDMRMFAFFSRTQKALWVVPISPDTSRPIGPPRKIVDKLFKRRGAVVFPTWSPDSKWIAFSSDKAGNRDIWVVSADGKELTRLTDDPLPEFSPWWSPDGERIIYTKRRPDAQKYDVWIISVKGGKPEKLLENTSGGEFSPDCGWCFTRRRRRTERAWVEDVVLIRITDGQEFTVTVPEDVGYVISWSPDGKEVIFFRSGYDYRSSLKLVNAYGGPWVELGKECKLVAWDQVWSADGERIITDSDTDFWWIIPTKGGTPVKLQFKPKPEPKAFTIPSFSPDLSRAAYVAQDKSLWIFPVSMDKSEAKGRPIKIGERVDGGPYFVSWSPDSKWIAFPSRKGGSRDIWVALTKGGRARRITGQPGNEPDPSWCISWSPDGRWISYSNEKGIWIVPSSGGKPEALVRSKEASEHAWSPNGKEIAFVGKSFISIVNVQTGEIRHILDLKAHSLDGESIWSLKWSPDGGRLGFIGFKEPRYRVWVVSVSGEDLMELAEDDSGDKYFLFWSPDGRKISYNSDRYLKVRTGALWSMEIEEVVRRME